MHNSLLILAKKNTLEFYFTFSSVSTDQPTESHLLV